ncbi:MAG: sodium-dependent transporter [Victivallales bacterium]|nr:sodium-dependent transporter [Victivallales bacterium]
MKRDCFSSRIGYVLAAAGSAVGLGNIWRFPYLTAKYGGGIFLLTYLILVLTFGYSLLIAENCIGRMTGKGPIGAFRDLCAGKTSFLGAVRIGGWLNSIAPIIIVPYYCVIGGWVTKYCVAMLTTPISAFHKDATVLVDGALKDASTYYFTNFITSTWEPILYFCIFAAILILVVGMGVEKGIERFNKILMPLLVLMCIGICIYCCFLPNAGEGLRYYLYPDSSKFSYMTVVAAMGQLFFSLSIAMGIMVTYGSYMRQEDNLVGNVNQVEIFDTGVAFLAGLMIIPAVVSFGGKEAAEAAGPGLVFCTMPKVFASFSGGRIIAIIFFLLVLFAAATSAISLLETNVQTIGQELKLSRKRAIVLGFVEIIVVGIVTILGYSLLSNVHPLAFIERYKGMDILDTLDFLANNIIMPLGAILTTILVTSVIGLERFCKEVDPTGTKWKRRGIFQFCVCVIVIPCLLIVLLNSIGVLK